MLQMIGIALIPLLAPNSAGEVLWQAPVLEDTNVWVGFRSITVYVFDPALALFLISSLLLLLFSPLSRRHLWETARNIGRHHGGLIWLALLIWSGISVLWAAHYELALYNSFHLGLGLFLALSLADYVRAGRGNIFLWALVLGALPHSLLAIAQVLNGGSLGLEWLGEVPRDLNNPYGFGYQEFRGSALAGHPNNLAGFLMIALFASLLLIPSREQMKNAYQFIWPLLAGGLVLLGLLASISRAVIVATIIILPIVIYFSPFMRRVNRRGGLGVLGLVLLLGLGLVLIGGVVTDNLWDRLSVFLGGPDAFVDRLTYAFPDTTMVIRENLIVGVGAGNLMTEVGYVRSGTRELLLPAHNVFWVIWAELGLVGLFLLVLTALYSLMRLHPRNHFGVFVWGSCLAAIYIVMLIDFYYWGDFRSRILYLWVIGFWWGYSLLKGATPEPKSDD